MKLYEILAVEPDLRGRVDKLINSTVALFSKGEKNFVSMIRTYNPTVDGGDEFPPESTEMGTTVKDELERVQGDITNFIDVSLQKEIANTVARDTVVVGEKEFLKDMPATALLNLEGKLISIRKIFSAIPVLPAGAKWEWDDTREVFVTEDTVKNRMKKVVKGIVLYEATPEHPAQVDKFTEDIKVGEWTERFSSGTFTVAEKRNRLARIDELIFAVKKARQRANDVEVENRRVGERLMNYINTGSLDVE